MGKNTINTTVNSVEERDRLVAQLSAMTFKEESIKNWYNLKEIDGYYVTVMSEISKIDINNAYVLPQNRNVFATKQQAESMLAYAQLTQLMKQVNKDWEPDWNNGSNKYTIDGNNGALLSYCFSNCHSFIAFPTKEIRDEFLINHRELLKTFYMINE